MELDGLGLTEETRRVYVALVGLPRRTAAEVAGACDMSAAAAGRLLSAMVRDGLAVRSAGRPPRFTARAPDVAISALIHEREQRLNEARSVVHRLAEAHREAMRISDPELAVELLTDRDDISAAVHRLTADATREVRAFDRPPYVDRPGSGLDRQLRRQRRGVAHRVIYDQAAVAWPGRMRDDILPSVRAGEQARVRPELPLKLVISDDQQAIVPFSLAPGGQSAAYLVHRSPLLVVLGSLFEALWERAVPVPANDRPAVAADVAARSPADPPGARPDPATRSLLTLLAAGLPDTAIARAQGWSERTTQRRIQRLMTELGATTRFQAGQAAVRRGWL